MAIVYPTPEPRPNLERARLLRFGAALEGPEAGIVCVMGEFDTTGEKVREFTLRFTLAEFAAGVASGASFRRDVETFLVASIKPGSTVT